MNADRMLAPVPLERWRELAHSQYEIARCDSEIASFWQFLLIHAMKLAEANQGWVEQAPEGADDSGWIDRGTMGVSAAERLMGSQQMPTPAESMQTPDLAREWRAAQPETATAWCIMLLRDGERALGRIVLAVPPGWLKATGLDGILTLFARFCAQQLALRLPHMLPRVTPPRVEGSPAPAAPGISCHTMMVNSSAGFYRATLSGTILECNAACAAILGYDSAEDLVRFESSSLFITPGERQRILRELRDQGGSLLFEGLRRRKDGRTVRLLQDLQLFAEESEGEPILHGLFFQLSDPRIHREPLERDLNRFRTIVESLPDSILLIDAEGLILYSGPSTQKIFGYTPQELESRSGFEYIHPEDQLHAREQLALLASGRNEITTQLRLRHRNGLWRWVELTGCNRLQDDELQAIVLTYRDITDRRLQDEEIWRSAERNRLILEAAGEVIWDWDVVTNAIRILSPGVPFFGQPPEEVTASIPWWYQRIHPEDVATAFQSLVQGMKQGMKFWSGEFRMLRTDGTWAPVFSRGYFIRDSAGTPLRMTGAMLDLSYRQPLLTLLQEDCEHHEAGCLAIDPQGLLLYANPAAQKLMEPAGSLPKGTNLLSPDMLQKFPFFESVREAMQRQQQTGRADILPATGHSIQSQAFPTASGYYLHLTDRTEELKMRLQRAREYRQAAIEGIASIALEVVRELLRDYHLPIEPRRTEALSPEMQPGGEIQKMLPQLVHDLEILGGQLARPALRVRIHDFLRRRIQEWHQRFPSTIQLECHPDPHVGSLRVDAQELEELLEVLVENAVLAMPRGGSLRIVTHRLDAMPGVPASKSPTPCVELTVADTGCGMSEDTLEHLFQPGFSGWAAGRRMGLGLPLADRIVRRHQGRLDVESVPGKGTEFHIYFPLTPSPVRRRHERSGGASSEGVSPVS